MMASHTLSTVILSWQWVNLPEQRRVNSGERQRATAALKKVAGSELEKAEKALSTDLETALKGLTGAGFTVQYRVTAWADKTYTLVRTNQAAFFNQLAIPRSVEMTFANDATMSAVEGRPNAGDTQLPPKGWDLQQGTWPTK